jgi:hypothetical protein
MTLVGRTIVEIRPMTDRELELEGWDWGRPPVVTAIVLDNGIVLYPSRDEDGNGPGEIFIRQGGILLSDGNAVLER